MVDFYSKSVINYFSADLLNVKSLDLKKYIDKFKAQLRSNDEHEKSLQKSNFHSSRKYSDSKSKNSVNDEYLKAPIGMMYGSKHNTSKSISSIGKMPMFSNMQCKLTSSNIT
jgi:hypothetical protein